MGYTDTFFSVKISVILVFEKVKNALNFGKKVFLFKILKELGPEMVYLLIRTDSSYSFIALCKFDVLQNSEIYKSSKNDKGFVLR